VTDVSQLVAVGGAASAAVAGIGRVGEGAAVALILDTEADNALAPARELRQLRVVFVHGQGVIRRQPGDNAAPALRQ
jgi:hypothetical protein